MRADKAIYSWTATYLQILTRLSHPPDAIRLTACCRPDWSSKAPGEMEGAQLTALQPIYNIITVYILLHI